MKQTITESYFVDQIVGDDYNNMSYDGAKALFEYFEQLEEGADEIEFDKVEIRCAYTEYENLDSLLADYDCIKSIGVEYDDIIEDLKARTMVIEVPNSDKIIIEQF
jgi:hypothetical protein